MDMQALGSGICTQCGANEVRSSTVRTAFWEGERLVVVEGIPALVCAACGERFFDDSTAIRLDLLRGAGFPEALATDALHVPVFSFDPDAPEGP